MYVSYVQPLIISSDGIPRATAFFIFIFRSSQGSEDSAPSGISLNLSLLFFIT